MASFRIHEDQENNDLTMRKDNGDVFSGATQRRALGDLNQFAFNQNRNLKLPGLTNGPNKVQDENRTVRQIKNEKNIVLPTEQFRAFSVYEDKPLEAETKKREPATKPFVSKEIRKDNYFINAGENVRALCAQVKLDKLEERQPDQCKELRKPLQERKPELLEEKDCRTGVERVTINEKKDVPESPMSVVDSSILSMSISKNESLDDIPEDDDDEKTTAQTDREMFFHVVEYREDIYKYMKEIEVKHRANPRYMRKQPDITHVMRSILIDWLVEVCDEYNQQSETLHLAVSYVDRFLSYMSVVRTKLQLVGTAATYIAAKYEEVYPPEVSEFVYITDDTYTKREVLRMEHLILKVLSFDLSTPTALAFLSHYCISNQLSKKLFHLAAYIAELSLLEADPYLQYKPSVLAASALATARHCMMCHCSQDKGSSLDLSRDSISESNSECVDVAWPKTMSTCSGYEFSELEGCVRELTRTHSHASQQPYQAIPDKYRSNKFEGVSSLSPRPMFPVSAYVAPPRDSRPADAARRP